MSMVWERADVLMSASITEKSHNRDEVQNLTDGGDYRARRVERVEGDTQTKIVFSGGTSVQEYEAIPCEEGGAGGQESGSSGGQGCEELKVEYIRGSDYGGGIGGILYTLREGDPSYTHYNNRGDVVAKTDDEQAVTYQATYGALRTGAAGGSTRTVKQNQG